MQIKIKLVDFYREEYRDRDFEGEVRKALEPLGEVVLSDEPDFLFCSCFGKQALRYDCTRILYIAENLRPNFNLYDYAIGNDWLTYEDRFLRLPWYNFPGWARERTRLALKKHEVSQEELESKKKFCSFVVSNYGANPRREQTFEALSAYKRVESGGRSRNNQPDSKPVEDKLAFLRQCRFNLAFENASTAGYCTEKIVDAFAAATVPIYWGDPAVERIYNPEAFINCNDCKTPQQVVEKVRAVEEDPQRWQYMLRQPAFLHPEQVERELNEDPLAEFIRYIAAQGPEKSRRRSPDFWQKNNEDKERQMAKLADMWWFRYYAKGERYLWRRRKNKRERGKKMLCDVVMPILMRDWPAAQINLPYVFRNLPAKRVVVVSSRQLEPLLPKDPRLSFVCEDDLLPGLTLQAVKDIMQERVYSTHRSGWLFQQFLKLGYARLCEDTAYITWDADTIPVRPVSFENEKGQLLFTLKEEYNPPYFETMENLLGLKKAVKESFIAENMIFDTALVKQMLEEMEANDRLPGENFWEKILWAIPEESLQKSGFSEFETFGTYAVTRAPGRYELRRLATLRSGKKYPGERPTPAMLDWAAESYDTISMEKFSVSTPLRFLAASERYRKNHTAMQLEEYKNQFRIIPAVYGWATHLWPNFKIWGGKYKRAWKQRFQNRREG